MGNDSRLGAGEVQVMSAGTGITHSEFNPSDENELHLLQIWIQPDERGVEPRYDQRSFPSAEREGELVLVAAPEGDGGQAGSLAIHADARIYGAYLRGGSRVEHQLAAGRAAWLHVARGSATVNGERLAAGDAVGIDQGALEISTKDEAEVLLFDLGSEG
jgi:redox-sensitive bicupin YhaK (pirin superfamily)